MDQAFQEYLANLTNDLKINEDTSQFLDFIIFQLVKNSDTGLTSEQILDSLNINAILDNTLKRLVKRGVIYKIGDNFQNPARVVSSIPGLKPQLEDEIIESSDLEPAGVLKEKLIALDTQNTEIDNPSKLSENLQNTTGSRSEDIFDGLDETKSSKEKKLKDFDFSPDPSASGVRDKIRQKAFSSNANELSSKNDDFDMDSLFDDALGESIEEFVSDFSDISIEETKAESGLIQPLVDLLIDTGYLESDTEADNLDEYKIMQTIIENHPISSENLENAVPIDSLSLMLSNLKADDLIDQTNDYRYTITKKVYKKLKDFIGSKKEEEPIMDLDRKILQQYIVKPRDQFLKACLSLSYIDKINLGENIYNKIPEYEVLKLLKEHEPISSDNLKNLVNETLPVVVSRMLSKLHADGVVDTDMDGNYSVTTKLYYYMVKDEFKADVDEDTFEDYQKKYE